MPVASYFGGEVTIAKANHQSGGGGVRGNGRGNNGNGRGNGGGGGCRRNPRRCQPPTVSELPIQYTVLSGASAIGLSGGMVFYIRKRKMRSSLEA